MAVVTGQQLDWQNVAVLLADNRDQPLILMYIYSMFFNSVHVWWRKFFLWWCHVWEFWITLHYMYGPTTIPCALKQHCHYWLIDRPTDRSIGLFITIRNCEIRCSNKYCYGNNTLITTSLEMLTGNSVVIIIFHLGWVSSSQLFALIEWNNDAVLCFILIIGSNVYFIQQ